MGGAVLTDRDARMGRADLDVQVRVTDRVAHPAQMRGAARTSQRSWQTDHARRARPAATPIMLPSAMPQSMKRSGHTFLKEAVLVRPQGLRPAQPDLDIPSKAPPGWRRSSRVLLFFSLLPSFILSFRPQISTQALELLAKLFHRDLILLVVRCSAVPGSLIFHEGNALCP